MRPWQAGAGRGVTGSPPRAWGQRRHPERRSAGARFTPTGVGTTSRPQDCPYMWAVHPHGRGDNIDANSCRSSSIGSPPRAWGQLVGFRWFLFALRFTPTGVGTTCRFDSWPEAPSVHPHGRGDNMIISVAPTCSCGSPPRAWGQHSRFVPFGPFFRFTPTGVGTTF